MSIADHQGTSAEAPSTDVDRSDAGMISASELAASQADPTRLEQRDRALQALGELERDGRFLLS